MNLQCWHNISLSSGARGRNPGLFLAAWCVALTNVLTYNHQFNWERFCSAQRSQKDSGWRSCLGHGLIIKQDFISPNQTVIQHQWPLSVSVIGAFLLQVNDLIAISIRSRAGSTAQWLPQSERWAQDFPPAGLCEMIDNLKIYGESPASRWPRKEVPHQQLEGPAAVGLQAGYAGSQMTSQTSQLLATLGRRRTL